MVVGRAVPSRPATAWRGRGRRAARSGPPARGRPEAGGDGVDARGGRRRPSASGRRGPSRWRGGGIPSRLAWGVVPRSGGMRSARGSGKPNYLPVSSRASRLRWRVNSTTLSAGIDAATNTEVAMAKKYPVTLTPAGRFELEGLIAKGKADARKLAHARVLLQADEADGGAGGRGRRRRVGPRHPHRRAGPTAVRRGRHRGRVAAQAVRAVRADLRPGLVRGTGSAPGRLGVLGPARGQAAVAAAAPGRADGRGRPTPAPSPTRRGGGR